MIVYQLPGHVLLSAGLPCEWLLDELVYTAAKVAFEHLSHEGEQYASICAQILRSLFCSRVLLQSTCEDFPKRRLCWIYACA
jgi:hypothetical protein